MKDNQASRPASWHRMGGLDYYSCLGTWVKVDSNWRDWAELQRRYDSYLEEQIGYKSDEVLKVTSRPDIADKIQIPAGDSLYTLEDIKRACEILSRNHEDNSYEDYDFLWNEIYRRAYWAHLRVWFGWRWANSHLTDRFGGFAMEAWEKGQRSK